MNPFSGGGGFRGMINKKTMTSTHATSGRLCNHLIRNIFVSILAERNNLCVDYSYYDIITALGIELFSGRNTYTTTTNLTDSNIMDVITNNTIPTNFLIGEDVYFQSNECSHYLYNYLRSDGIMNKIVQKNKFGNRYKTNNDVFLHIRLGDSADYTPGFKYYDKVLSSLNFDGGFIASDSPYHPICSQLKTKYPTIQMINANEVDTMLLGSTCKHIVLSHGSFSAIIGYIAFFSDIYYPMYETDKKWYGDMFTNIPGWIRVEH
jgi:hypothetical protein